MMYCSKLYLVWAGRWWVARGDGGGGFWGRKDEVLIRRQPRTCCRSCQIKYHTDFVVCVVAASQKKESKPWWLNPNTEQTDQATGCAARLFKPGDQVASDTSLTNSPISLATTLAVLPTTLQRPSNQLLQHAHQVRG